MSGLDMWTVYQNPRDRPGRFVARRWQVGAVLEATADTVEGGTLEEVRSRLPGGLSRMARADEDDPVIVETWF